MQSAISVEDDDYPPQKSRPRCDVSCGTNLCHMWCRVLAIVILFLGAFGLWDCGGAIQREACFFSFHLLC